MSVSITRTIERTSRLIWPSDGEQAGSPNFFPAFYLLALVVANHSIFRLGALSFAWTAALIVAVAAVAISIPTIELRAGDIRPIRGVNLLVGFAALAPLIASVVLGWRREFPFGGDQGFHLKQTIYMAYWWLSPIGSPPVEILGRVLDEGSIREALSSPVRLIESRAVIFLFALAVFARCYFWRRTAALILAVLALVAWGLFERAVYYRYPGAWYLLATPFIGPAYLAGNIELAGRLATASAAAAWLFLLRPFLVGRWPDAQILPAVALVLWQKDALYYFDSVYLEPWAVVFSLLAVEILLVRGRAAAPVACLLIGLAAAVKEPPILTLPFVWLAGAPWRGPWRERVRLSGAALAAGFPFLLYFAARKSLTATDLPVDRGVQLRVSYDQLLIFFKEYLHHTSISFAGTGRLTAIFAVAVIPFLLWRKPQIRTQLVWLFAAGAGLILFFALDQVSFVYPGEFRFVLYSLPFLVAGMIALGYAWRPRLVAAIGLIALLVQLPDIVTAVTRSAGPSSERNFVENYDNPIVLPLKSMLAEARQKGFLPSRAIVLANRAHEGVKPVPGIDVTFGPLGELYCECTAEHPNVLALFVRYANLNAPYADQPPASLFAPTPDHDRLWRAQRAERPMCVSMLRKTCGHVLERVERHELVGALGTR